MRNLSFEQRVFLGFGMIVVLLGVVVADAYRLFFSLLHTNQLLAHSREVRAELTTVLSAVEEAETGQRGYLLTDNALYLQPYVAAQSSVTPHLERLSQLTVDNAEQQQQIPLLTRLVRSKLGELHQTILLYDRNQREAARKIVLSDRGRQQMEAIRQIIARMRATENRLLEQRTRAVSVSVERTLQALTVLVVLIALFCLLAFFFTHRSLRQRRLANEALRASEARYRRLLETSYEGIWTLDAAGRTDFLNSRGTQILDFPLEEIIGLSAQSLIVPEDLPRWQAMLETQKHGGGGEGEFQLMRRDGNIIFVQVSCSPIRSAEGVHQGLLCMFSEITDRKRAEAERTELIRRMVTVQEEERRRISRELHDEMGQYLTALILGLDAVEAEILESSPIHVQIRRLQQFSRQVGQDVHRIAWELRPTALDDLGLEAALQNYVEEWSERVEIVADFHCIRPDRRRLPPEIETTLYRAAQEALNNVAKHAHAERVSLILECQADYINLIVEDNGVGIAEQTPDALGRRHPSMGLVGIQERVGMVGGVFTLESTSGQGTTLFLRIPLTAHAEKSDEESRDE